MQLDQTLIGIRERRYSDILDLALQVIRNHFVAWLVLSFVGAAPAIAVNMLVFSATELEEIYDEEEFFQLLAYGALTTFLAVLEIPLAAMPLTIFLGQALFLSRPRPWVVFRDCVKSLPQMVLLQFIGRIVLTFFCITLALPYFMWPYLSEIVLLERNPLFAGKKQAMTTLKRSGNLHGRSAGDLFGRWLAALLVAGILIPTLWLALRLLISTATGYWDVSLWYNVLIAQVAAWIVISYFTVVRYLSYLDLRIRTEGWEIELAMRAEGARLARSVA